MPKVTTVRVNGPVLRGLRTRRGLTVRQLAGKISRHPQSVRYLETGTGKLASEVLAWQIANALGIDIADFTGDTTEDEATEDEATEPEGAAAL